MPKKKKLNACTSPCMHVPEENDFVTENIAVTKISIIKKEKKTKALKLNPESVSVKMRKHYGNLLIEDCQSFGLALHSGKNYIIIIYDVLFSL